MNEGIYVSGDPKHWDLSNVQVDGVGGMTSNTVEETMKSDNIEAEVTNSAVNTLLKTVSYPDKVLQGSRGFRIDTQICWFNKTGGPVVGTMRVDLKPQSAPTVQLFSLTRTVVNVPGISRPTNNQLIGQRHSDGTSSVAIIVSTSENAVGSGGGYTEIVTNPSVVYQGLHELSFVTFPNDEAFDVLYRFQWAAADPDLSFEVMHMRAYILPVGST